MIKKSFLPLALLALSNSAYAASDIRQCPIGQVTFADGLSGSSFVAEKVGYNFDYLCEGQWVKFPTNTSECRRFGDITMVGQYDDKILNQKRKYVATWSVGASAPCCGWSFDKVGSEWANSFMSKANWIDKDKSMTLEEIGVLEISAEGLTNDLVAVKCN